MPFQVDCGGWGVVVHNIVDICLTTSLIVPNRVLEDFGGSLFDVSIHRSYLI